MNDAAKELVEQTIKTKVLPLLAKKEPEIKAIIKEKAGTALKSLASNEPLLKTIFEKIHELLPAPLKLVVSTDTFVNYCISNKDEVLKVLNIA
jgi:hypothetical protein